MEFNNIEKVLNDYLDNIEKVYKQEADKYDYDIGNKISTDFTFLNEKYTIEINLPEYWKYIEDGRKPGKRPPTNEILKWTKKKNIRPKKGITDKQMVFLICRKIGRDGIKPKKLLDNTLDIVNSNKFYKELNSALRKDLISLQITEFQNFEKEIK